jgi:hypothetical protein
VFQTTFSDLDDFIAEHRKDGMPDRHIARVQMIEDAAQPGKYQVVVTSLRAGQVFRYVASSEVYDPEQRDDPDAEKEACIALRQTIADALSAKSFDVRLGIWGVAGN